jgi:AhpD family alkylhydroperoxidase
MPENSYQEAKEDLEETFGMVPPPLDTIPEDDAVQEWPTFKKYTVGESEIPPKYRELIGLAIAANIKCPYCAHFHNAAAQLHGATDAELEEAYFLSSFTARYSSMLHAQEYDLDTFKDKVEQIGEHLQAQMAADD